MLLGFVITAAIGTAITSSQNLHTTSPLRAFDRATTRTFGGAGAPAVATVAPSPVPFTPQQLDAFIRPDGAPTNLENVVSLIYNGNRHSGMEPCHCPAHRLGGIEKEARVVTRTLEWGIPSLRVDAGGMLRENPAPRDRAQLHYMLAAMHALGYEAVNVGLIDLGGGIGLLRQEEKQSDIPFVSANLVDATSAPLFQPYRIVEVGLKSGETLRVGITGVTRQPTDADAQGELHASIATMKSDRITALDPVDSVRKILPDLRAKSDMIILLTYQTREAAPALLRGLGHDAGIEIAVCSEMTKGRQIAYYKANLQNVDGVKLLGCGYETRHVGHMMIAFNKKSPATFANKLIELEQSIPVVPEIQAYIDKFESGAPSPTIHVTNATTTSSSH